MAKSKTVFFCTECGGESVRWMGQCPHCGVWNSLVEEKVSPAPAEQKPGRVNLPVALARPVSQVTAEKQQRLLTAIPELDTVLGGGLMPGSSVLLGGEPGIGKSTLLLQTALGMTGYGPALYISGEEAAEQIRLRAERVAALDDRLFLLAQTDILAALDEARRLAPVLVIIDSVQALFSPELDAAPGSVSQVRAVAAAAIAFARETNSAVLLIGHVTKEGALAGPRVLEHMVDTVLYFEGERYHAFRLLRAVKNRFGSTNEIGVFEMAEQGLLPLSAPSAYFLAQRQGDAAGSAVTCVMQGARPVLIEIQALVSPSGFNNPRRLASGFDYNRLQMIIAVLERKLKLPLDKQDVYVNVAGGLRLDDTSADLAVAAAIVSSWKDIPLEAHILLLGELSLLGELRLASQEARRLKEAAAFGFTVALVPAGPPTAKSSEANHAGLRRLPAASLPQALQLLGLM